MTSKKLSVKRSIPGSLVLFTFKKNMSFTAVIAVISALLGPCRLFKMISDSTIHLAPDYANVSEKYKFSYAFPSMTIIFALLSLAFLLFLIVFNFSFLYKKNASDAFHAFPLTRTRLLLCRFIPSLILSFVPLTIGYAGELAVAAAFGIAFDFGYVAMTYLFTCLMLILCGSVILLFTVCAGTMFDMLVSLFGINIGIPVIILSAIGFCEMLLHGFSATQAYVEACIYSSPFVYFFYHLAEIVSDTTVQPVSVLNTAVIILLGTGFTALATALYNRRKSEKAGEPYAFRAVPVIIGIIVSFLCGIALGLLFSDSEVFSVTFWIFSVIGCLLGAVCYGAIARRGFKTVRRSLKIGAVSFAVIIAIVAAIGTGGFGYVNRIPAAGNIESAELTLEGGGIEFKNPQLVLDLHKTLIADKDGGGTHIDIEYRLKNGRKICRAYKASEICNDKLLAVYKSAEYRESLMSLIDSNFSSIYFEEYKQSEDGNRTEFFNKDISHKKLGEFMSVYTGELSKLGNDSLSANAGHSVYISLRPLEYDKVHGYEAYRSFTLVIYPEMEDTAAYLDKLENIEDSDKKY